MPARQEKMNVPELELGAQEHVVYRHAAWIEKRSGSFPWFWHSRFMVVSRNFLFEYTGNSVRGVRFVGRLSGKIDKLLSILLQGTRESYPLELNGRPFSFKLETRSGREFLLAAPAEEDREQWMRVLQNAPYEKMMGRSYSARKFLDTCNEIVRPLLPSLHIADETADNEEDAGGATAPAAAAGPAWEGSAQPDSGGSLSAEALIRVVNALAEEFKRLQENDATGSGAAGATAASSHAGDSAQRLRRAENESSELRREVTELRQSLTQQRERVRELEQALHDTQTKERQARAELATLAATTGQDQEDAPEEEQSVNDLRRRIAALEVDHRAAQQQRERLERSLTEERHRVEELEGKETQFRTQRRELEAQADEWRARADTLRRKLETAEARITQLEKETGSAKSATAAAAASRDDPEGGQNAAKHYAVAGVVRSAATSQTESKDAKHGGGGAGDGAMEDHEEDDPYEQEWEPFYWEAQALEQAGRFTESQQQYETVLQMREERCGRDSVEAAAAARDLGRVLALQRNFDEAETYYSRAADLCDRLLGKEHANTACARTDLAAVLREQGKFADAEAQARLAVESLKAGVGEDDVSTATALYNYAGLAKRQGKYDEAETAYAEALDVFMKKLGEGQGETADTLYQMGSLYRRKRDYRRALHFFNRAADSYSRTYGPTDRRVDEATRRARAMSAKAVGAGDPVSATGVNPPKRRQPHAIGGSGRA